MSRMPLERTALLALVLACGPGLDEGAAPTPVTPSAWAESFESAEAEARWQGIDTCGDSTEIGWVVQGGYLESYGNCRWEPDKAHLGSFRRDATSRFDAGWLVAEVAVDDDGRWGLLWGTEGAFFRFGLARDTNSATLDLVALPGYDFAGRVAPSAVDGHLQRLAYSDKVAAPYLGTAEIAIHRTPERTTAWVDRAPVLWLEGDPFGTTTVGVYVWRMSHLKLDRIAIYDDGPPPWERPL